MKLIVAILRDVDNEAVSRALVSANFRVTCVASTGGFLRRGQTTLLIGVEDVHVNGALEIIRNKCTSPTETDNRRTTLFVLPVSQFLQF
jgi:uncharacterized protein YaaQ